MQFVDDTQRGEQHTGTEIGPVPHQEIEIGELDRYRTTGAGRGVLKLQLGVEDDAVGELIAGVQHKAQIVGRVAVAATLVAHILAVICLAIATDRQALLDAVNFGGRRSQAVSAVFHAQRLEVGHGQAGAQLVHFLGQDVLTAGLFLLRLLFLLLFGPQALQLALHRHHRLLHVL